MNKENKLGMGLGALLSNSNNENSKGLKKLIYLKFNQTHLNQGKILKKKI